MTTRTIVNGAFPIIPYRDPRAALAWLERCFDARVTAVHPADPAEPLVHAEVVVGTGNVGPTLWADDGNPFHFEGPIAVYVVVDDPDALHAHVAAAGAEIVMGLTDQDYGSREFAARDCDGNVWCFGTYRPEIPVP